MIAASHKPEALHALLLEEINLARIENYAGDLLVSLDRPTTSPIRLYSAEQSSVANSSTFPPAIFLPRNVLLLGTLNHDETTMRLSPKVKDRSVFVRVSSFNHQVETVTSDLLPVVNLHAGLRDLIGRDAGLRDGIEGDSETANEVVKAWADLCELRATSRGAVRKAIVLSARTLRGLKALCSAAKWLKLDVSTAVDLFVSMKLLPWLEFYGGDQITLSDLISFKDDLRKKGYGFSASEVEFLCEQDDAAISYLQ